MEVQVKAGDLSASSSQGRRYTWLLCDAHRLAVVSHVGVSLNDVQGLSASWTYARFSSIYGQLEKQFVVGVTIVAVFWALYQARTKWINGNIKKRSSAQLEKREREARALHDTLLQGFQGIALQVQGVAKRIPVDDPLRIKMEEVLDVADEALYTARESARNLYPQTVNHNELSDRIAQCGGELVKRHPTKFILAIVGRPRTLDSAVQDETYDIAGDAMRNAFLYAAASRVEVEITYSIKTLSIRVRDDGVGIEGIGRRCDDATNAMIEEMHQRAHAIRADLQIWSRASTGTEVELVIPAATAYLKAGVITL
jgi:signal transduction histidine kinase